MVALSHGHPHRTGRVPDVCQLGGVAERPLLVRTLYFALLFARVVRQPAARALWAEARLVSEIPSLLAGSPHPLDPRPVPRHVLLLPRRLLQIVLGRPPGVRSRRT